MTAILTDHEQRIHDAMSGRLGPDQRRIADMGIRWLAQLISKNADYGSSVWKTPVLAPDCPPGAAIRVRMSDKVERLMKLLGNPETALVAESIDDTMADLAGYCLLELARPGREVEISPAAGNHILPQGHD
jgi:hypothetical protein